MSNIDPITDKLLSSLLQPKSQLNRNTKLIEEIGNIDGENDVVSTGSVHPQVEEGPTLLEQMMAAQLEAKKEKDVNDNISTTKEVKSFGGGFKKGFFGGSPKTPSTTTNNSIKPILKTQSITKEPIKINQSIPTITKNKSKVKPKEHVFEEVQEALREDENPLMAKLKGGEWMTPNLMEQFKTNPIISKGLSNPKCQAAIQTMQRDPAEAKRLFASDPDVDIFMREFGKLMSTHFESFTPSNNSSTADLKNENNENNKISEESVASSSVQEIGPLHAEVLKNQKIKNSSSSSSSSSASKSIDQDEERVKEVLEDEELRTMLMDPELQRILQECGDPIKFQVRMRDPAIAYKIKRLYKAGLVGTAK